MRHVLFGLFVLLCAAALVWPLYPMVGNSVEPRVLGLPWSFAWNVLWVTLSFFALLAYHLTDRDRPDEEPR